MTDKEKCNKYREIISELLQVCEDASILDLVLKVLITACN